MPRQFSERVGNIDSQMSSLVANASADHVKLREDSHRCSTLVDEVHVYSRSERSSRGRSALLVSESRDASSPFLAGASGSTAADAGAE